MAQTPETFTYDDDGNLLTDGRWSRTYDAENRLIAMETLAVAYNAGAPRKKIEFRYDGMGRTIGKKVSSYNSGWSLDFERRFIYDGWQMIAELSVSGSSTTLLRTYAWGLDVTGSLTGAGGVGGLLMAKGQFWDSSLTTPAYVSATLLPVYDGNGNVMGGLKTSDGSFAAAFEYDAFGQTVRATGPLARDFLLRFSTKWTDSETGELNYGRRFYSPTLGRFTTRDPIEEKGGLNLYAFVLNNPVTRWDYLGMECHTATRLVSSSGNCQVYETISVCDDGGSKRDVFTKCQPTLQLPTYTVNASNYGDLAGIDYSNQITFDSQRVNISLPNPNSAQFSVPGVNDKQYTEYLKRKECAALDTQLNAALAAQKRYGAMFAENGSLSAFQGADTAEDVVGLINGMSDSAVSLAVLSRDSVQVALHGWGVTNLHQMPEQTPLWENSPAAKGAGYSFYVVGTALDLNSFAEGLGEGDHWKAARAGVNAGASTYALIALSGPGAVVIGGAQVTIDLSLYGYQKYLDSGLRAGFANTVLQTKAAQNQANESVDKIQNKKSEKGCP